MSRPRGKCQGKDKGQGFPNLEHTASHSRGGPQIIVLTMTHEGPHGLGLAMVEWPLYVKVTDSTSREGSWLVDPFEKMTWAK